MMSARRHDRRESRHRCDRHAQSGIGGPRVSGSGTVTRMTDTEPPGRGFRGEIADFYRAWRRGYPDAAVDAIADTFGLTAEDTVVDLGCGTGQLTIPLAARAGTMLGVDPEPDMLAAGADTAAERGVHGIEWVTGTDADLPGLLAGRAVAAVTVGQALHWMDHERVFAGVRSGVRAGGGIAVVTNGAPLWLHDVAWSRALRDVLESWLGIELSATCGTDDASQARYRDALTAAGFAVATTIVESADELDVDAIVGGVWSAMSPETLPPPAERPAFTARVAEAIRPHAPFVEPVRVTVLTGRVP